MTAEIVAPFGDYATPGAVEDIVDRLRTLLGEAERGEVVSLLWGVVRPNDRVGFGYTAGTGDCNRLVSSGELARALLVRDLLDKGDA